MELGQRLKDILQRIVLPRDSLILYKGGNCRFIRIFCEQSHR